MITEHDLQEAIAELKGRRNPTSNDCIKLAAYYTILDNLQQQTTSPNIIPVRSYATSNNNAEVTIEYKSNSDLSNLIYGKSALKMWSIVDELMSVLAVINPKLYNSTMQKFNE